MSKLPQFQNQTLLNRALTHRSYINENPTAGEDNERLEFLGDAILNFVTGAFLYERYPQMSEAQLTRLRSTLVNNQEYLAKFAKKLGLDQKMLLGKGAIKDGGRDNPSLLSDTFEAVLGAYFLDAGIEAVRKFVEPLFVEIVDEIITKKTDNNSENFVDSKNLFQQWALANVAENPQRKNPQYITTRTGGTDDDPEFTAKVCVNGKVYGLGKGKSKKESEKLAAEVALKKVGLR